MDVISIGAPFAQKCKVSRVFGRYDSTLQLETRGGALWAITTQSNPGARRVVVPALPDWRDGATVRVRAGRIFAEDVELTWDADAWFDPVPRQRALSTAQRCRAAQAIAGALTRWQLPDALGFWGLLSEMWEPLERLIASPAGAKQSPCNDMVEMLVSRLIGRGPGLTPTGDDFLQALLVTLSSGDAGDRAAFDSLAHVVTRHLSRTTRISRAFLEEAMQGWAFGALKVVLDALPEVTQGKIDALLSIGATSGPAYTFGVLMGLSWKNNYTTEVTETTEKFFISVRSVV